LRTLKAKCNVFADDLLLRAGSCFNGFDVIGVAAGCEHGYLIQKR